MGRLFGRHPTLNRFFSLHYLLPFIIAGVVVLHIWALHVAGQNNPAASKRKPKRTPCRSRPTPPSRTRSACSCFLIFFAWFIFYMPNYLGDADNYIPANPGVTPAHIVPEWYYLPFYAILRSVPNKLAGVIAMFSAIIVLAFLPWLDSAKTNRRSIARWRSSSSGSSSSSACCSAISAPSRRKASM